MNALSHNEYIRQIRPDLPPEAFALAPGKLVRMFGYLALVASAYLAFRLTSSVLVFALLSIFIGHTLACIGFLAHELAHGAIIRARFPRYALEYFFWALVLIPATVWKRVHNHTHHAHANTSHDPDRRFLRCEKSPLTHWYTRIFYPNNRSLRWNPLVAFHLIPYIIRNVVTSFYSPPAKPSFVPARPSYSSRQLWAILSEILGMIILQGLIFAAVGRNWFAYLWASPIAYLITSTVTMAYIFTNHFLNPISETNDPVLGSTSVVVPPVFDSLHENFSFHTEHHLFPAMNSDFYPLVASAIHKRFPERYNRLGLLDAWRRLWNGEEFISHTVRK